VIDKIKSKKIYFAIIALILGIVVALLFSEAALRLLRIRWLEARMAELNAGDRKVAFGGDYNWPIIKEGGKKKCFVPFSSFVVEHYEYKHIAHTNQWGCRVTAKDPYRIKSKTIIPFVGDSFTFGVGVGDYDTYVSLIDAKLKEKCINLGFSGGNLSTELDIVEMRHHELGSPHLYVFSFYIGNDLYVTKEGTQKKERNSKEIIMNNASLVNLLRRINIYFYHNHFLKKSFVIQFMRQKLLYVYNEMMGRGTQLKDPIFLAMDKSEKRYLSLIQATLDREFERLTKMSEELNFKPVFIIIPQKFQVNFQELDKRIAYYGMRRGDIFSNPVIIGLL